MHNFTMAVLCSDRAVTITMLQDKKLAAFSLENRVKSYDQRQSKEPQPFSCGA